MILIFKPQLKLVSNTEVLSPKQSETSDLLFHIQNVILEIAYYKVQAKNFH